MRPGRDVGSRRRLRRQRPHRPRARPSHKSKPVLLNTAALGAASQFCPRPSILALRQTIDVLATDTDADGDVDIVGINASGSHQVFTNNGAGQFTLRQSSSQAADARNATAAKLSVDDRVDIAVVGASRLDVFYNDGAGNFGTGDTAAPIFSGAAKRRSR